MRDRAWTSAVVLKEAQRLEEFLRDRPTFDIEGVDAPRTRPS